MDFIADIFTRLHELAADADSWQQIAVLLVAGAIPFVESYLGAFLGVLVGVPPVLAVAAAVVGNIICTFTLIAAASGVRTMAMRGRGNGNAAEETRAPSKRQAKVKKYFERLGVPGVSILGPIVVASQITAPALVALGAPKRTVYLWQGIAIVAWGVLFGFFGDLAVRWFM